MASFSDNFKQNLKQNIRDEFESRTGIIGQALRDKRRREEQQAKVQEQVQAIQESTSKITHVGTTLSRLETSFIQISKNIQLIAKSFDAQVTLQEETNKVLQERAKIKRDQKDPVSIEPQKQQQVQKQIETPPEDKTLFEKILDTISDIDKFRKSGGKKPPTKTPPKTPSKGGGKLGKLKTFGKLGGKILGRAAGPASLALGAYEASEFLAETGYGKRMAEGGGKRAEQAFKEKNTDFSNQPLTAQQAQDILDSKSKRDIEAFGGRERLEKIAGTQPVAKPILPATGAGGGRGSINPPAVIPEPPAIPPSVPPNVVRTEYGIVTSGTGEAVTSGAPAPVPPAPPPPVPPPPAQKPAAAAAAKPSAAATPTPSGGSEPLVKKISPAEGKKAMLDELDKQKITDPVKRAAIMAQAAVETGGFQLLSEDLRYSPEGMKKTFGRLKDTPIEVLKEAISKGVAGIGSLLYGGDPSSPSYQFGVKNLGNTKPGDGFLFRGRGFFQLTGRSNYAKAGAADNPQKLLELGPAAETAVNFANRFKGDFNDVSAFTKFVNGGLTHVKERGEYFAKFLQDPSITTLGASIGQSSVAVAAAKSDISRKGGSVTVAVIQQAPETKKAAPQQPRSQVMTSVG